MWYIKDTNMEINSLGNCPDGAVGFIYLITDSSGKIYIGKKQLFSSRKTKITQKEKLETNNNRKKFKTVVKESDWLLYNSSCKELQDEIKKAPQNFKKEIIEFCFDKRELTFYEVYYQIKYDVLFKDSFNKNILSRFFVGIRQPKF